MAAAVASSPILTVVLDFGLGLRRPGCLPFLGEGIFVHDGLAWKHSREVLRRQFARVQANNLEIFEEFVEDLVSSFAKSKGTVDLQPAFFRFTLGTTTALLFGESVTGLAEEEQAEFAQSFDHASEVTAIRLRLAEFCWLYTPKKFRKSCDVVKRTAEHFVQKALQHERDHGREEALKHYPFILELYEDLNDPIRVRDQLVNVLLAGRDTTACTLSWTL
jgi:cytochrome P450